MVSLLVKLLGPVVSVVNISDEATAGRHGYRCTRAITNKKKSYSPNDRFLAYDDDFGTNYGRMTSTLL